MKFVDFNGGPAYNIFIIKSLFYSLNKYAHGVDTTICVSPVCFGYSKFYYLDSVASYSK